MVISKTYATKETTSSGSLLSSDHTREWATFDLCFFFSTRAHTSRLMADGAIPASMYRFSTLVSFRHPVITLYAVLNSESST